MLLRSGYNRDLADVADVWMNILFLSKCCGCERIFPAWFVPVIEVVNMNTISVHHPGGSLSWEIHLSAGG